MPKHSEAIDRPSLLAAAVIVAVGGLIYELLLGTAASYLFGDSITSFSIAIGVTLFGMGIGSLAAIKLLHSPGLNFVRNEIALSLIGGNSVLLLFAAFSFTPYYWLIFVLISLVIGFAIGLEIPLMVSMAKEHSSTDNVNLLSKILALDYIGALVASLIFPFLLLPQLGLVRTAYLVALLNIAIAWFIMWRLKLTRGFSSLHAGVVFAVALLAISFAFAHRIEQAINTSAFKDPVIYYEFSKYQKITVTQYQQDTRLYLNNQLQFSSLDEARYHETLAHAGISSTPNPKNILILGGGDGMLAREVLKYGSVSSVTIIDIDPAVTKLGRQHRLIMSLNKNSLADSRVKVINEDAFTYANRTTANFDVILSDLVDPSNEKVAKLYSLQFYTRIQKILSKDGTFITQATSSYFTPRAFRTIHTTAKAAFMDNRTIVPLTVNVPSFGEWGFIMALPKNNDLFQEQHLPKNVKFVSVESLRIAEAQSGQASDSAEEVSTLLKPDIYLHYQNDMQQWRY